MFQKPKSRVAGLVAYKAAADVAAKLSLFVITVVAARRLTPDAFGVFALGSTVGWIAGVAADFGMQMHLARGVAKAADQAPSLLRLWLRVRIWTTIASIAMVVAGLAAFGTPIAAAEPILIFALVYAVGGLVEFLHYFYRGLSRSDIESSLTVWQRAATLGCAVAGLIWWPTAAILAVAMLIPVVVTLAVSLRIARRLATTADIGPMRGEATGALAAIFRRDVAPIGVGILLSALYFRVDVFLVQLWAGSSAVGLYNAVFRVIEGLRLFPAAALAVALPAFCRARDVRPLASTSLGLVGFAVAVTIGGWFTAGTLIPLLFGEPFAAAVPAFRILLLAFPLLSLNYALTQQLIAWDGHRAFAAICAFALAANVALNARLIPWLAIDGAAWATLGTEVVVFAGCALALGTMKRDPAIDPMARAQVIV